MQAFNALVEADNVVNQIRLVQSPAAKFGLPGPAEAMPAGAAPSAQGTIHEVVKGDTLSGLAKRYLGNGNLYMKIFEANRDQLKDPNLIKIGQKLRIPK
ncbi:MAG: LysM peptidoglycan-binding domain-containing protein [Acidobacteria bacterium]|nr:LysM peptidoglycan-binding domain-containing protein [Acidobacteriota bacterium]